VRIVYSRSSTATQSLLRQRHILTEAGLLVRTGGLAEGFHPAEGVLLFEDPATTSKIPALERPAFAKVAAAAIHIDLLMTDAKVAAAARTVDAGPFSGAMEAAVSRRVLGARVHGLDTGSGS
jgi:hypothetical protein